jgi:anti-sigma B factor antagonist
LDYISSAGLRVLLRGQRMMSEKGGMVITNVKDTVMEVFEMTGFIDILTIK